MAIYNEILVARFSRAIQKLFSMKGSAAVRQVAGEVVPTIVYFFGAEGRFLENWGIYAAPLNSPATAAQTNGCQLRNPTGSNVIAVVEKITISSSAATSVSLTQGSGADLPTVSTGQPRADARINPLSTLVPSFSIASPANLGNALWLSLIAAGATLELIFDDNQEIVLLPGTSLRVINATANVQLVVSFFWRERFLEESERQ